MKFTRIPTNTFAELQINAGILAKNFTPATGALDNADILGATTGGITATCTPTFTDYGDDIDNCPKNVKELKRIDAYECKLGGTFLTVTGALAAQLIGAADVDGNKVTPRRDLKASDFDDVWFIGDYTDKNGNANGGFIAIHLINALSTSGFSLKTADKGKGQFAAEFTGHVSIDAQDVVPMEFYVKEGTAEASDFVLTFTSAAGTGTGATAISALSATTGTGESYVYQTGYNLRNPGASDILAGSAWTAWDGDDEITAATGMEIIIAIITTATGACQHAGCEIVVSNDAE